MKVSRVFETDHKLDPSLCRVVFGVIKEKVGGSNERIQRIDRDVRRRLFTTVVNRLLNWKTGWSS